MMKMCSIASGSSGNCIYIGTENVHLLVDAGVSAKRIEEGLRSIGVESDSLNGIFITHEHSDHIQGLPVFTKKHQIPIYATKDTLKGCISSGKLTETAAGLIQEVQYGQDISFDSIIVSPFEISHDAVKPVSYSFCCEGHKIGMVTDLGTYSETTVESLKDSEILYMEANHDVNMLMVGAYPYKLKQRILGERGHLSNDSASELIRKLLHPNLKHIVLGHLSKENNYPELAFETVRQEVKKNWSFDTSLPDIFVANREKPSKPILLQ